MLNAVKYAIISTGIAIATSSYSACFDHNGRPCGSSSFAQNQVYYTSSNANTGVTSLPRLIEPSNPIGTPSNPIPTPTPPPGGWPVSSPPGPILPPVLPPVELVFQIMLAIFGI